MHITLPNILLFNYRWKN